MIDRDLANYITVISNGSVIPMEGIVGDKNDKLIYRLILQFKDKSKTAPSTKFVKRLISKLRMLNSVIYDKTQYNRYELKQKPSNDLYIIDYYQGDLKENKNGSE